MSDYSEEPPTYRHCPQCGKDQFRWNFPIRSDICDFCVCANNEERARREWEEKRNRKQK